MKKRKNTKRRKQTHKKRLTAVNLLVLLTITLIISCLVIYSLILDKEDNKYIKDNKIEKTIESNDNYEKDEIEKYRKDRIEKFNNKNQNKYEENNKDIDKEYHENEKDINKKIEKNIKPTIKKEENKDSLFINDIKESIKIKKEKISIKIPKQLKKKKAKLILIIDDVSSSSQVKSISSLKHNITMSFLPPSANHKNSAKIAQKLPFYMIHIPLEASKAFKFQEKKTLLVSNTYNEIDDYVKRIRQWYPKGIYINNHTGSKFTSNDKAMDKLFRALKKYNFIFVDSRTIGKSLGKKYAKKYNMPYLSRNIFLDNNQDFRYIQNQLKKSIKIAKKNGVAIAIGHPYSITIKVLRKSNHLFKDIDLIYLNSHPKLK